MEGAPGDPPPSGNLPIGEPLGCERVVVRPVDRPCDGLALLLVFAEYGGLRHAHGLPADIVHSSCADRRLTAIFATPVVAGAPDTLTTNLALLAFVNGEAIGLFIPRPPVRPIIPIIRGILIIPIRGRFKG
jgi:hypothetical protein